MGTDDEGIEPRVFTFPAGGKEAVQLLGRHLAVTLLLSLCKRTMPAAAMKGIATNQRSSSPLFHVLVQKWYTGSRPRKEAFSTLHPSVSVYHPGGRLPPGPYRRYVIKGLAPRLQAWSNTL
jgi:hypothetical protein